MPEIYLYAELLTNIRQISLYVSLQTPGNGETKVDISSDKKILTVIHDGVDCSIYLPTQISGTASLTASAEKRHEISVRLHIDDDSLPKPSYDGFGSAEAPWSAQDLSLDSAFGCKSCNTTILGSGTVGEWQDLPSENWSEMMDFWHCHKPHEEDAADGDQAAEKKGYAATSQLRTQRGKGLVDLASFVLSPDDCPRIKSSNRTGRASIKTLHCNTCDSLIGRADTQVDGYRLYKSRLLVTTQTSSPREGYSASTFICAQLLSLIDSQATRKFVLHSPNVANADDFVPADTNGNADDVSKAPPGLLLWVFNPDIHYSSSLKGPRAYRAMKVFYQHITDPADFLESNANTAYDELRVSPPDFDDFKQAIKASTAILPKSARKFPPIADAKTQPTPPHTQWHVGLLDRYERTASTAMDDNPLARKLGPMDMFSEDQQGGGIESVPGFEGLFS